MVRVRIATRTSKLALLQVEEAVAYAGKMLGESIEYEIVGVKTLGDKIRTGPIHKIGSPGAFAGEVNTAVLEGLADIAVHSLKDLPAKLPSGLEILFTTPRRDPRDSLVPRAGLKPECPANIHGTVGTSSPRRAGFLRAVNRKINIELMRGNIDTRLRRLDEGQADYIVVAEAALQRLKTRRERQVLPLIPFTPAPGQGYIAVVGMPDTSIGRLLSKAWRHEDEQAVRAEHAFISEIGGTCGKPVGGIWHEGRFIAGAYREGAGAEWRIEESQDPVEAASRAAAALKHLV